MKHIGHVAIGSVIQQVLSIAIFMILTHHLGATEYGMVAAALALATSIYNFSSTWITPSIVKTGVAQLLHYSKLGDIYIIGGLISLSFIMLGLFLVFFLKSFKIIDIQIYGGTTLLIMLLLGLFFIGLVRIGLQATQSFREYGYFLWMDKIFLFAIVIILFNYEQLNSQTALYANAASMLLIAILGLFYFCKKYVRLHVKTFSLSKFLKTTTPIFFATIALYFASPPFVILLVSNLFELEQAGFVGVGFIIYGFFIQPIRWITPTLLPKFTIAMEYGDKSVLCDYVNKVIFPFTVLYSIGIVAFISIILSMPIIISYLIGDDFQPGIPVIILIINIVVAEVVHQLLISMLYARQQEKLILIATVARSLFFILMVLLFSNSLLLILIGLLVGSWINVAVEIWALKDLFSWKIKMRMLIIFGLFTALSFFILITNDEIVLSICGFIFIILGIMTFENRAIFLDYIQQVGNSLHLLRK
ncbi:hypothetical protein QUF82_02720 [Thiotrichales bacterium HSG14]|nr:hypothetical protein [Thiotrichales bacterium HSG14]